MKRTMKRTIEEMHEQIDMANEAIENGPNYNGLTYEQGVKDALLWVMGETDEKPIE